MQRIGLMLEVPTAPSARRARRRPKTRDAARARAARRDAARRAARTALAWLSAWFAERRAAEIADLERERPYSSPRSRRADPSGKAMPAEQTMARQEALALADRHDEAKRDIAKARAALRLGRRACWREARRRRTDRARCRAAARDGSPRRARAVRRAARRSPTGRRGPTPSNAATGPGDRVQQARRAVQRHDVAAVNFDIPLAARPAPAPAGRRRHQEVQRIEAERDGRCAAIARSSTPNSPSCRPSMRSASACAARAGARCRARRARVGCVRAGRGDLAGVLAARRDAVETRLRLIDLDAQRLALRVRLTSLIAGDPLTTTTTTTTRNLAIAGALLALGADLGYDLAQWRSGAAHAPDAAPPMAAASAASAAERKVLYWYDPMVPGQKFDAPGKSPFMDMQLVPRYADRTVPPKRRGVVGDRHARAPRRSACASRRSRCARSARLPRRRDDAAQRARRRHRPGARRHLLRRARARALAGRRRRRRRAARRDPGARVARRAAGVPRRQGDRRRGVDARRASACCCSASPTRRSRPSTARGSRSRCRPSPRRSAA